MISPAHKFVCDTCHREVITDLPVLPPYWTHGTYDLDINTGYGYAVTRTNQRHFCCESCKKWWEMLHPELKAWDPY